MTENATLVDVGVDSGTLWIGSAAYPLRNISSVEPVRRIRTEKPERRKMSRRVSWGFIGGFLVTEIALGCISLDLIGLAALLFMGAFVIFSIIDKRLHPQAQPRTWAYYQLHIGAGGKRQVALNVASEDVAHELTRKISGAIANPEYVFGMQVENLHIGDNNTTYGPESPIGSWQ